jgi:hypothetical protein
MARINAENINDDVLKNFKNYVINKHGKLKGAYSIELEKAITSYLCHQERSTHTQNSQDEPEEEEYTKPSKKGRKRPITHSQSSYYARLGNIMETMKINEAWYLQEFPEDYVKRLIKEKVGGDKRTIEKYATELKVLWDTGLTIENAGTNIDMRNINIRKPQPAPIYW